MIGLHAALLSAAAGALDCSPPPPAEPPDPAGARAYLEVGDEERRQGSDETALQAYREALRLDPKSSAARARMMELCRPEKDEAFVRAVAAVEEGRHEDAARLLEPLHRARPDAATALLYGIALYELGEDQKARPLLEAAARDPSIRESATLFLGLILLRSGSSDEAAAMFDRVSSGRDLAALARRESRLAVSAILDSGYDNNVDQAPDLTDVAGLSGDVLVGARASALLRPSGERGLQATASVGTRNQLEIDGYDLVWAGGTLGYAWGSGPRHLRVDYAYDHLWLGGEALLSSHQLSASGRVELGILDLRGRYAARMETFLPSRFRPASLEDYSGLAQDAGATVALSLGGWAVLAAGYRGQWDQSRAPELGWTEHGPRLELWASLGQARAGAHGELTFRRHLASQPGNLLRQDVYLDAEISIESDVSREVTLFVEVGARKAYSNLPLEYTRFAGKAGLIYTAGLW